MADISKIGAVAGASALSRRAVLAGVLAASLGALAIAFTAQYAFGIEPCVLCLYQRVPYAATAALAGLALIAGHKGNWSARTLFACSVVFAAGAALAFYHVGVERHWWSAFAACAGVPAGEISLADLRAALAAPRPKACDEPDWSLFGVTLAGYNTIASLALALFSLAGAMRLEPRDAR